MILLSLAAMPVRAAEPDSNSNPSGELARRVANPLATLISVPFQLNVDHGIGPLGVRRTTLNVQPVVPVGFGARTRWKLISRTILPVVDLEGGAGRDDVSGVGDVTQSLFVTPTLPRRGGWMIGAGPVVQLPTASRSELGGDHWNVGPTAVAVRQAGPWTYGALANHLWSVTGPADRPGVSLTFVQPFLNYVTPTHTTLALNTEANRDWKSDSWSVPVHFIVNQLIKVGPQPMSLFLGARYWAKSPRLGPRGWGLRAGATLLFPGIGAPGRAPVSGRPARRAIPRHAARSGPGPEAPCGEPAR